MAKTVLHIAIAILFTSISHNVLAKTATITHHRGGGVMGIYSDMLYLDENDTSIRFDGVCSSACTVYLGAKDTCVTTNAQFEFHQAQKAEGLRAMAEPNPIGSMFMMNAYPDALKKWIADRGGLPWFGWLYLDAIAAVELGVTRFCK